MGWVEQVEHYRDDLFEEVALEEGEVGSDQGGLSRLAAEREAILACLDRVGKSMIAAGLLGVPIPDVALGLIVVFVVIGEVADEILSEHVGSEADAA